MMWKEFFLPSDLETALKLKDQWREQAKWVSGGTDMLVDLDSGRQKPCALIDLSRLDGLAFIRREATGLRIGGGVTHARIITDQDVNEVAPVLARAALEVGSPQIRNRSTLSGNIVTASPAADTVPPLLALDARIELVRGNGRREMPLSQFISGFRQVDLADNELIGSIFIPYAVNYRRGVFLKLGLRQAQAITVVSVTVVLETDAQERVTKAAIALGSVAPTVIRVPQAEQVLTGKILEAELIETVANLAMETAAPIADVRASAEYRKLMVRNLMIKALNYLKTATEPPETVNPQVTLQIPFAKAIKAPADSQEDLSEKAVELKVNGKDLSVPKAGKLSLLYALRKAGLNGTKEGCLEGECGACTVLLNGKAVDSCLVPAPAAQNCEVTTIEGLAQAGELHPLQKAFIEEGGVQCGFCTPGLIMAGSAFLAEHSEEAHDMDCRPALVGNLCRCTGYSKVIKAIETVARAKVGTV
jgi:xanthine dehydrogenase iron-sulfur cluster and FAD-binding subunit A